jgi:CheY-like chemotaxis protein
MATTEQTSLAAYTFPTQEELPPKLIEAIESGACGYWRHQFDRLSGQPKPLYWHVAIANGHILYSGGRVWSAAALFSIVHRYCPAVRSPSHLEKFHQLRARGQDLDPSEAWQLLARSQFVNEEQLFNALSLKILNDLDIYCSIGGGRAEFVPDSHLTEILPIQGLSIRHLMTEFQERQVLWHKLTSFIPSMSLVPKLDREMLTKFALPAERVKRIEELVQPDRSLKQIAEVTAKDPLEVAQMFAQLVMKKIVTVEPPASSNNSTVVIIDDSPLMLKQFQKLVTVLGYNVVVCQDPSTAISLLWKVNPAAIFIDINMPGISGFELVKQIRKNPQLREIPITILTGEQKHSNKWRAEWSNCQFLIKPLLSHEVNDFQSAVQKMLQETIKPKT